MDQYIFLPIFSISNVLNIEERDNPKRKLLGSEYWVEPFVKMFLTIIKQTLYLEREGDTAIIHCDKL